MLLAPRLHIAPLMRCHLRIAALFTTLVVATGALGCADIAPGVEIAARVSAPPLSSPPPDTTIEAFTLTITSMELLPCPAPTAALLRWILPEAHAHADATPTLVGTPVVLDLVAGTTFRIGTFTPPPGRYCEVEVLSTPADDDAFGVSEDTLATTVRFVGTHAGRPIVQTTARSLDQRYPLSPPLSADGAASVELVLDATTWFDPPALPWTHPFDLTQTLLVRAFESATVRWTAGEQRP